MTRHLWRTIDEVVLRPIEKVELQARTEVLLRARGLSVALQRRHTDMEAFLRAMTHELRATAGDYWLRGGIAGYGPPSHEAQHCLCRIRTAAVQAQDLITSL